jgi:hypothetical protein
MIVAESEQTTVKPYLHIDHYPLELLSRRQIELVKPDFKNADWFSNLYQSRAQKKNAEYYSLRTMLEAVHSSEAQFKQFPVDERNLKALARSIFTDQMWLQQDPTLAVVDGSYYIVGGRHRINAIATTLAQVIRHTFTTLTWTDEEKQARFESALEQNIRCEVLYLHSLEDLLVLITSDNESRTMRKAETSHLIAQAYGADAESLESVSKAVLGNDLSPSEAVAIAGQNFVRRPSKLKPQTKQVIGEKVAKHVLYGTDADKKLSTRNNVQVSSIHDFEEKMDKAWDILSELIEGEVVIAKNSSQLAKQISEKLDADYQEKYKAMAEAKAESEPVQEVFTAVPGSSTRSRKKSQG